MSKHTPAEQAIRNFDFWDYGMDAVDPKSEYAEWVPALAAAVEKAVRKQVEEATFNIHDACLHQAQKLSEKIEQLEAQRDKILTMCTEADLSTKCPNTSNHDPSIIAGDYYCWRCNGTDRFDGPEAVGTNTIRAVYNEELE